jgi:hypothetical protein
MVRCLLACAKSTCQRGIYDNMKTAVTTILIGKERLYNRRFLQMCSHYLVDPVACTPASGWEKGQVENQVGLVRERFFTPRLRFKNYDELNAWLLDKCIAYAKAHRHPEQTEQTVWQVFEAERPKLVPYAGRFDGFHAPRERVLEGHEACSRRWCNSRRPCPAERAQAPERDRLHRSASRYRNCSSAKRIAQRQFNALLKRCDLQQSPMFDYTHSLYFTSPHRDLHETDAQQRSTEHLHARKERRDIGRSD